MSSCFAPMTPGQATCWFCGWAFSYTLEQEQLAFWRRFAICSTMVLECCSGGSRACWSKNRAIVKCDFLCPGTSGFNPTMCVDRRQVIVRCSLLLLSTNEEPSAIFERVWRCSTTGPPREPNEGLGFCCGLKCLRTHENVG